MKRRALRTDFGRWRAGGYWFVRGRSLPATMRVVGQPDVFMFFHGLRLAMGGGLSGTVNALDIPAGAVWVTP